MGKGPLCSFFCPGLEVPGAGKTQDCQASKGATLDTQLGFVGPHLPLSTLGEEPHSQHWPQPIIEECCAQAGTRRIPQELQARGPELSLASAPSLATSSPHAEYPLTDPETEVEGAGLGEAASAPGLQRAEAAWSRRRFHPRPHVLTVISFQEKNLRR